MEAVIVNGRGTRTFHASGQRLCTLEASAERAGAQPVVSNEERLADQPHLNASAASRSAAADDHLVVSPGPPPRL
jgi:hypothetical protein